MVVSTHSGRGGHRGRRARTRSRHCTGALLLACAFACGSRTPSYRAQKPPSLAAYPHAADRYTMLARSQLTAADPTAVEQQMVCEGIRLENALGGEEALRRIRGALDTAYRTRADSEALQHLGDKLADQEFGSGDNVCDSIIAAWDSNSPILPETTGSIPR